MSILHKFLISEIKKKFNLSPPNESSDTIPEYEETDVWGHHAVVTQEVDELNEFVYKLGLKLTEPLMFMYFEPHSTLSYILLPKIKLHWQEKISQTRVDGKVYNIITEYSYNKKHNLIILGNLDCVAYLQLQQGSDFEKIANGHVPLLISTDPLISTIRDCEPPRIRILRKKLKYAYPMIHFNVVINRQGIHVNRKHREKQDFIDCPSDFFILEPFQIIIEDKHKNSVGAIFGKKNI